MIKKTLVLGLAAVMAIGLVACGSPAEEESSSSAETSSSTSESSETSDGSETAESSGSKGSGSLAEGETIDIGCCVMNLANEVFAQYNEGYEAFVEAAGGKVNVNLVDGGGEVSTQVEAIENFINMDVDGIMLNALDTVAVEDVVNKAMDNDIIFGVYPSMENVTFNFVFDEYDWGYALGEAAGAWINDELGGEATIMIFNQAETEETMQRYYGIVDGINATADEEKLVYLEPVSTTDPSEAMESMESILQAHPEVRVVLGSSDSAAVGAYQALTTSTLPQEEIFVGGCDGISEAVQYVQEDTIYRCTVGNALPTSQMGFELLENICKCYLGMDYDDPYKAEVTPITIDNVDDYLALEPDFTIDPELAEALGI